MPVLGFVAENFSKTPPIMSTGAALTALMAVEMGKVEASSIPRLWRSWSGATTTWAPVSATVFCWKCCPALCLCLSRGGGSDRAPYAALSIDTDTGNVGAVVGLHFLHPSATLCM